MNVECNFTTTEFPDVKYRDIMFTRTVHENQSYLYPRALRGVSACFILHAYYHCSVIEHFIKFSFDISESTAAVTDPIKAI